MASHLCDQFESACDKEAQARIIDTIYKQSLIGDMAADGSTVLASGLNAGANAVLAAQSDTADRQKKEKEEHQRQINQLLADLHSFEDNLAAQYGDNFAEDLLADLVEGGKFTQDEYMAVMAVEDQQERRRMIAEMIQDKLDSGEITMEDLEGHKWVEQWLDKHEEISAWVDHTAEQIMEGKMSLEDVPEELLDRVNERVEALEIEQGQDRQTLQCDLDEQVNLGEQSKLRTFSFT